MTAVAPTPAPAAAAAADPSYLVRAKLFRTRKDVETPLTPDITLVGGDQLSMQIESSIAVYVYVINADDAGKSYRLFPLPDVQPDNPLAAAKVHRLPGEDTNWVVNREGGREHFVVVVTPVRNEAFEAVVRTITPATAGAGPVTRSVIPPAEIGVLRSVGGLAKDQDHGDRECTVADLVRHGRRPHGTAGNRERRLDATPDGPRRVR